MTKEDLSNLIKGIIVKDYGDFKRKAVLYLNRFVQDQCQNLDEKKISTLREIKNFIQYHPNFDIESTKQKTLDSIKTI